MLAATLRMCAPRMRQVHQWPAVVTLDVLTAGRCYNSQRFKSGNYYGNLGKGNDEIRLGSGTTTPSGALLPEPKRTPFGLLSALAAIVIGVFVGATISKWFANFLEEKELFVPSDDDDDDDDDD